MMKSLRKLYRESSTVHKRPEAAVAVAGTYTGERLNGLKHGKGKKMMRKFEKSEPDEYSSGEEVFPDHSKYIGEFENGFAHGQGSRVKRPVTHPSRCNWDEVSDMMFFEGEMIYADGSKYKGKWEKGNYHGKGEWTGSDGSSYDGEWKDGVAHGEGIRKTALGNEFEGIFDKGRPFEGQWTSPDKIKTPYLAAPVKPSAAKKPPSSSSKSDPYIVFALEMYLHVVIGFLMAYYVGYIQFFGFNIDMLLLIPIVETVVQLEKMFPRIKAMVPHDETEQKGGTKKKRRLSSTLRLDASFLEKVFIQSRMDTINVEYEWFNYTLAQFWHTYDAWLGNYIRMLIEQSIGSMNFMELETCTLGQSPITVTNMRAVPRNNDPKLREDRAQDAETTDEDLIVDLYFDIDWRSDAMIKLKLWHLIPISVQDIFLKASMRVVLQWVALDHNDALQFPNLAYLGLESLGRADLSLSLILFGFFDLFSIPPLGTLLAQDFLLDLLYDFLGPGTGFWLDFLRGRATEPFAILENRLASMALTKLLRKEAGDVKGLKEATTGSKLQVSVTVVSSRAHNECSPFCVLRMGTLAQIDSKEAKSIEKQTTIAKSGTSASWNTETFTWLSNPSPEPKNEDWLSVTLMSSSRLGSPSQIGNWKASLSEIIHQYELLPNGPPKKVTCYLSDPKKKGDPSNQSQEKSNAPSLCLEFSLSCLGLPQLLVDAAEGVQLMDLDEKVKRYTGVIHIQLKDCHNLHHKMHSDLTKSSVKLEPYLKFHVGSKATFESSFGKAGNLKKGIYAKSLTVKNDEQRFHKQQSKHIAAGQEMAWNDADGKFIFDTDIPAIDLCILAQVFHGEVMLGQTFLEIKKTIFDPKTNRFVLRDEQMIQILASEDNLAIPYHGDPVNKEYWEIKPFEELMKFEIPLMTLFVSFVPKTYSRPSIRIVIMRAEKLPKMDAFSGKADPFVIVSLGTEKESDSGTSDSGIKRFQTGVVKKSLEPCWVENNIFTLNLDAEQWKDEVLTLVVMDHETVGASREIGSWKENIVDFFKNQKKDMEKKQAEMKKNQKEEMDTINGGNVKLDQGKDVQFALTNASGKNVGYLWCNISFLGDFWGLGEFWGTSVVKEFVK